MMAYFWSLKKDIMEKCMSQKRVGQSMKEKDWSV